VTMEAIWVNVKKCHPNNFNPNVMNPEKFDALCDFLKTHSAEELDPIWVRHDGASGFEIIDGEHRWKAAKTVGWKRLRAFVIPLGEEDAKAFNVRKNRERGQLDAFKLARIFLKENESGLASEDIAKKYGYAISKGKNSAICYYIDIAKNEEAIRKKIISTEVEMPKQVTFKHALRVLRELKHPEKSDEPQIEEPIDSTQTMERFLSDYKEALKKMPKDTPKEDDVQVAIKFFKKLLNEKNVVCPICGETHLQWRCGHDF